MSPTLSPTLTENRLQFWHRRKKPPTAGPEAEAARVFTRPASRTDATLKYIAAPRPVSRSRITQGRQCPEEPRGQASCRETGRRADRQAGRAMAPLVAQAVAAHSTCPG